MKCQILLFWKNKKDVINLSSAELAQREVKVKPIFNFETIRWCISELFL